MVSLIIGYENQEFLSQVVEYLSKDIAIAIMDKVNQTKNTSTEGVEEATYIRKTPTAGTEVIDNMTGGYPSSPKSGLKPLCLQVLKPFQIQ